jgi:hypothetical protein
MDFGPKSQSQVVTRLQTARLSQATQGTSIEENGDRDSNAGSKAVMTTDIQRSNVVVPNPMNPVPEKAVQIGAGV